MIGTDTETCESIQRRVCDFFHVDPVELVRARGQRIAFVRQVALYLCRELTDASFPEIARKFGGLNHTTVIHACKVVKARVDREKAFGLLVDAIAKGGQGCVFP